VTGPELPIGDRIREYREKRGRRQVVVAGLCGITVDYLSQIERGMKVPSLGVLLALARELGVPPSALLGEEVRGDTAAEKSTALSVAQALLGYRPSSGAAEHSPASLRERVEAAWRIWQTSKTRFTEAAAVLPDLICDVEDTRRTHRAGWDAEVRREVDRIAADLYFLLRSYCRRTGRVDLSLMAADRAMRAAEDADDPIRIAAAQWNFGHVLLANGEPEGAKEVALLGAKQLSTMRGSSEATAMAGALQLIAVVADARRRQWWSARDRLRTMATPRAEQAGEGNVKWTVFGPTNVELHAVSIDMEAGESAAALRTADSVDTSGLPSLERRFTFLLEVARCYDLRREDAAVLVHLLDLEQLAPEDLARSPLARQMVANLRKRVRPTYRRQITELAERLCIP
jgi:transcriptional regulator with XRE-family HTH domain